MAITNPLPPGTAPLACIVALRGAWSCDSPTSVQILLNRGLLLDGALPDSGGASCDCPACGGEFTVRANVSADWNFPADGNATNWWHIWPTAGVLCLSNATLTLTFGPIRPTLRNTIPAGGVSAGGTPVLVEAEGIAATPNLTCSFGGQIAPARLVTPGTLSCISPAANSGRVDLRASVDGATWSGAIPYYYYFAPEITEFAPHDIAPFSEAANIDIEGRNFPNAPGLAIYPRCRLLFENGTAGGMLVNGTLVNAGLVRCVLPALAPGNVSLGLSFNGVDYGAVGLLAIEPSSLDLFALYGLISGGAALLICIGIGVLGLIRCKRARRRQLEQLPLLGEEFDKHISAGDIRLEKSLGRGGYAEVHEGIWKGTLVAVKSIPIGSMPTPERLEQIGREIAMLRSLRHPQIVQFYGCVEEGGYIRIVMELLPGGTLFARLHPPDGARVILPMDEIKRLCVDICRGMNFLHGSNPVILHRDLKSQNILLTADGRAKVADFGLSRAIADENAHHTACGTPAWTAPEVLGRARYGPKADVYSFGVILWEMLTGEEPWGKDSPLAIIHNIVNDRRQLVIPANAPEPFQSIARRCLCGDPSLRPTFGQILRDLGEY